MNTIDHNYPNQVYDGKAKLILGGLGLTTAAAFVIVLLGILQECQVVDIKLPIKVTISAWCAGNLLFPVTLTAIEALKGKQNKHDERVDFETLNGSDARQQNVRDERLKQELIKRYKVQYEEFFNGKQQEGQWLLVSNCVIFQREKSRDIMRTFESAQKCNEFTEELDPNKRVFVIV